MAILHYIDNEVPDFAEWDSVWEEGSSTIARSGGASFPERGSYGLLVDVVSAAKVYVQKNLASAQVALAVGLWFRLPSEPTWSSGNALYLLDCRGTDKSMAVRLQASGSSFRLQILTYQGANEAAYTDTLPLAYNRWYYVAAVGEWDGSGAQAGLYLDGVLRGTASKAGEATSNRPTYIRLGNTWANAGVSMTFHADEVKVATSYPEPYVPTPPDEYPCAERTCVLFRQVSSISEQFADYCVSQLGIPRANLIPLAAAAADESLADYATFQTQVEDGIDDYFALNPTVADNCSCFLVGFGVPGYFVSGGVRHSATARLMNYGTAFSSQTANPLYAPSTVSRLTQTALGGKYLACRIDLDTVADAKTLIDRALTVAALAELPDTDTLYCDEADYLASLGGQHLRILTAALGTYANDAFIWGNTGTPSFGTAGSRAVFVDDSTESGYALRTADPLYTVRSALLTTGYAAGLGECVAVDGFDAKSFFEMLRVGGTLAEAFAVAVEHLDYVAVAVGNPLMTVAFQDDGYNLYRGAGGIENVDFDSPVAYLRKDNLNPTLTALGHAASTPYTYVLRPVRGASELVTPDLSCNIEFEADGAGDWLGDRPAMPHGLAAAVKDAGKIEVRWGYTTPYGESPPADFGIYYAHSPDITPGSPQATETYTGDTLYAKTLSLTGGQTYYLAVTARSSSGVESHLSEIVGPCVADASAPAAPQLYASASF